MPDTASTISRFRADQRLPVVFPRNAVRIEHEGSRPFVADSNVVPLYNAGHPYTRPPIDSRGDRTDWFSVAPSVLREMLEAHGLRGADADRWLFHTDFSRVDSVTFLHQRRVLHHVQRHDVPDALFVEEAVIGVLDRVLAGISSRATTTGVKPQRSTELGNRREIRLSTGLRHGFIYRPLDAWVKPAVAWAKSQP